MLLYSGNNYVIVMTKSNYLSNITDKRLMGLLERGAIQRAEVLNGYTKLHWRKDLDVLVVPTAQYLSALSICQKKGVDIPKAAVPKPSEILNKHINHLAEENIFKNGGTVAIVGDGGLGTTVYHMPNGSQSSKVIFNYDIN